MPADSPVAVDRIAGGWLHRYTRSRAISIRGEQFGKSPLRPRRVHPARRSLGIRAKVRLQHLFFIISLLLSLTVISMTAGNLRGAWDDVSKARGSLEAIEHLQVLLVAAEMASRERGPANGVLGDDLPGDPARRARLKTAREQTDQAFSALQDAMDSAAMPRQGVGRTVGQARAQLIRARAAIDLTASRPRSVRSPEEIRSAVSQMFGVIDALGPAIITLTNEAQTTYPSAANALMAARLAADLREYAGQLGSQFTVVLTTRQPLSAAEQVAIERLRGRVELLRKQLLERTATLGDRAAVQAAMTDVQSRYFESAIPFVEALATTGLNSGRYGVDTAGFAARYVPDMDAIVALRDVLINEALADARSGLERIHGAALWMAGGGLATLTLLGVTLWMIHRRVVRPLGRTAQLISAIAEGQLDLHVPKPKYRDELADVLNALAVLRQHSETRLALEEERQRLVDQLRDQSNTDFLTGLPNRRGFFELAEHDLTTMHRHGHPVTLAIFDLDHFKQINDTHGHAVGDNVLVEVAALCCRHSRSGDVVARYGGEEFLVLMPYCTLEDGALQADRLRRHIEALRIPLPDGGELHITASFGVEQCLPSDPSIDGVISRADERLYIAKSSGRNRVVSVQAG